MILTTTPGIEGHPVVAYFSLVTGEAIIGCQCRQDMFATVTDIVGGRSGAYETKLGRRLGA